MATVPATFYDDNGVARLQGRLDGTSAKWVDCGIVSATALLVSGKRTLYTTGSGEFVAAIRFGATLTVPDSFAWLAFEVGDYIGRDTSATDWYAWITPAGVVHDAAGLGIAASEFYFNGTSGAVTGTAAVPPLQSGAFTASIGLSDAAPTLGTTVGWQANHGYGANTLILAAAHMWTAGGAGTSGGSAPDFAGNIGGTVVDNNITWSDGGAVPTQGQAHVYLEIVTPA